MKKATIFLGLLLAAIPAFGQGTNVAGSPTQTGTNVAGGGTGGTTFNQGPAIIDPLSSKYGAKADGHSIKDATTTSGSKIVSCPNADCNFLTTAVVGQRVFANQGFLGCNTGTYVIGAGTTITSIDSDTQIHVSNNAAANCAANAALVWGDVDQNTAGTGPLQLAWNDFITALNHGPAVFKIPCGIMPIDGGFGSTTNFITPQFLPTYQGCGPASSIFIVTPDFVWTTCPSKVCIFNGVGINAALAQNVVRDFAISGIGETGNCPPATGYTMINMQNNTIANNVYVNEICNNASNGLIGMAWGAVSLLTNVQSDFAGTTGCAFTTGAQPIIIIQAFCGDANPAVTIAGTGIITDYDSTYQGPQCGQGIVMNGASTFSSYGTDIFQTVNMAAGARFFGNANTTVNTTNCGAGNGPFTFSGAATVNLQQSNVTALGTTQLDFVGTGTYIDSGGNSVTPGTVGIGTAGALSVIADGHSVKGTCTGVGTAASTLGLYGTGANVVATTCTSVLIGTGQVFSGVRTMRGLFVTATAAGTNASSGVVTVLQNGGATAITCTIGTGTSCTDGSHSVSLADGDRISIQFTTQVADTLAGVKAIIDVQ